YRISAAQARTNALELDPRIPRNLRHGRNGYDAKAWGVWHLAAWDGKLDANYARELVARIGCSDCRSHATRQVMKRPIPADKLAAFYWTVDFHNEVSRRIGKKTMSYEDAQRFWSLS